MHKFDDYNDFIEYARKLDSDDKELNNLLTYHDVDYEYVIDDFFEKYKITLLGAAVIWVFRHKLLKKLLELGASTKDRYLSNAIYFRNYMGVSALISHGARCMNSCLISMDNNSALLSGYENFNTKFIVNVAEMVSEHVDMLPQVLHEIEKIAARKRSIEHMFVLDVFILFI